MLTIENLTHVYGNGTRALDDVSLSIPKGMFGLLGPNGAGKSTLMRSIATLQTPTSGSIRFGDIDVIKNPEQLRRVLGYLPQDFGVYPRVSAYDMLDHMAVLKGISNGKDRKQTVEALLNQVNLWPVRGKALAGFSGGMRQRFGIAQALIGNPELIIVDEPTAGLDPEERNRFLNLLAAIGEQVVVILSTHIVEDVTDLCPRMAIIARGEVRLAGEPREAIASLDGRIDMVLDGGPTSAGVESTIVAVRADGSIEELRPGPLNIAAGSAKDAGIDARIEAPGQLASHYAPGKPVRLNAAAAEPDEYLIGFGIVQGDCTLSASGDVCEAAARLYACLHEAAGAAQPRIAVAPVPEDGVGRAINDRLRRAAA